MINKHYKPTEKKISVYTGAHGAGKSTQFYKDKVYEFWVDNGELPVFINETQRNIEECFGLKHYEQKFNLEVNINVLFLLYSNIISNDEVTMDRCFLDVLIYSYYFDNEYRYKCNEDVKKAVMWFIDNAKFYICEPQKEFFNNSVERMDFESALEIHKLFLDIDNVLSKILGFDVKLNKEYIKIDKE